MKKTIAWWIPLFLILAGIGVASTAPIPVAKVKVGNETVTITTADIMYRYVWRPVKKDAEQALSRIPGFVQENVTSSIAAELDRLEANAQELLGLDVVKENWASVISTVKDLNLELTGVSSTNVIICAWKGVFEVCRTYKLNEEEPGFTKVADEAIDNYLRIRLPYGVVRAVNEAIERGELDEALKIFVKAVARGELELPHMTMEKLQEKIRLHERLPTLR